MNDPIHVIPEPRPLPVNFGYKVHNDCAEVVLRLMNAVLSLQERVDALEAERDQG